MTMPDKHRYLSPEEAYKHITRAIGEGLRSYTTQTGLELKTLDVFELRLHRELWRDLRITVPRWNLAISQHEGTRFMDIPVFIDDDVDYDHPELRCTWKWVI